MENIIQKLAYSTPEIVCVALDHEISLQLDSSNNNPPFAPGETAIGALEQGISTLKSFLFK